MQISFNTFDMGLIAAQGRAANDIDRDKYGKAVGRAKVKKITSGSKISPETVYITNKFSTYYILDRNGECLGSTTLHLYKPGINREYGVDFEYKKFPGAVYVENMESLDDNYLGIGTLLHNLAVSISNQAGYGGRVLLDAEKSSHIFHYKFGFRSMGLRPWLYDEAIEREIERAERKIKRGIISSTKDHDTSHLGPIAMYLPVLNGP